jgi:uncharacterized membrane protein YcaP (DUF421 family)
MEIVLRASAVFWFLWLVTRFGGKKLLSDLEPFELLLLVVVGDLIQQGVTGQDYSVTAALLAVATIVRWILLLSFITFRFKRAGDVLGGVPMVIVREGIPLDDVLRSEGVRVDEIREAARQQGIADLNQIAYAVFETDGKFSFIRKDGLPASPPATGGET